jgi:RHS repeat-associated protein
LLLDDSDHSYIYGPSSTPIAQVDDTSGAIEYLHADALGTPRAITNSAGAVTGTQSFDAYGTQSALSGAASTVFGFTGNLTDAITGLLYLRARDYDPATGQFLTVDPALDSTHQPYAYAGNDPVFNTDPTGLDFLSDVGDNALAFGAGVLDDLTWGVSGAVLSQMVPGYDCFVENHQAAFTAGVVVSQGVQLAVMIMGTAGAGTGLALGLFLARTALKDGLKVAAKTTAKLLATGAKTIGKSVLHAGKGLAPGLKGLLTGAPESSKILLRSSTQLQKKFKHASDFGVKGNYSRANASTFSSAIHQHINSAETMRILGSYRNTPSILYVNAKTGLNVVTDLNEGFVTAFKLGAGQLKDVLSTGRLW